VEAATDRAARQGERAGCDTLIEKGSYDPINPAASKAKPAQLTVSNEMSMPIDIISVCGITPTRDDTCVFS